MKPVENNQFKHFDTGKIVRRRESWGKKSTSPCLELTKKAKERKNSVEPKLKTFLLIDGWKGWETHLFCMRSPKNPQLLLLLFILLFASNLSFYFFSHCHFFRPVSMVWNWTIRASIMETLNFEVLNGSHIDTSLFIIF